MLERDGRRFTIRPEKVRILGAGDAADGLHVEEGTVRDVGYVGAEHPLRGRRSTRGGELIVIRQNLETSHDEARDLRGQQVRVGWRAEQTYALDAHANKPPEEEA